MGITLEKLNNSNQEVRFNNKLLGHFIMQEDGYYMFFCLEDNGGWSSYSLKLIADKLDEVNKEFNDEVNEYFDLLRRNEEQQAKVEYKKLLNESGMFFEFYPHLTGVWKDDKLEWFNIYKELSDLRAKKDSF